MSNRIYNALFICTGNSARSILAEALLNHLGRGRFRAYSAGSHPKGAVHPLALETLQEQHVNVSGLSSKSWDVFGTADAPKMDFIFTVCDNAAGEMCPLWPGQPATAHWGFADPAAVEGDYATRKAAFAKTFAEVSQRLQQFLQLPFDTLDHASLQQRLQAMGEQQ